MSEDALNSSDAGRDYLTRYQRAIAGKTQQQFELETSEWQSQMDAWNAAVETVRQTNPNATSSELSELHGDERSSVFEGLSLCANIIYVIYGLLLHATPFIIGCAIAVGIHVYHIHKIFKSKKISTKLKYEIR